MESPNENAFDTPNCVVVEVANGFAGFALPLNELVVDLKSKPEVDDVNGFGDGARGGSSAAARPKHSARRSETRAHAAGSSAAEQTCRRGLAETSTSATNTAKPEA